MKRPYKKDRNPLKIVLTKRTGTLKEALKKVPPGVFRPRDPLRAPGKALQTILLGSKNTFFSLCGRLLAQHIEITCLAFQLFCSGTIIFFVSPVFNGFLSIFKSF